MKEVIKTLDPRKNKLVKVGVLDLKTGKFVRKVDPLKHKLRKFDAYGIQDDVFGVLTIKGCKTIIFKEPERELSSDYLSWLAPDIKTLDYGSGKQRFMPVNRMEVKNAK